MSEFKVGDRVRFIDDRDSDQEENPVTDGRKNPHYTKRMGWEGTVVGISSDGFTRVNFGRDTGTMGLFPWRLELVSNREEESPPQKELPGRFILIMREIQKGI